MIGSISGQEGVLYGYIKSEGNLTGNIFITVDHECYTGNYHIIPKVDPQVLMTCDKVLTQDITVEGIPIYEVSNPQGGTTIIIGG